MLNATGPIQTVIITARAKTRILGKKTTKDNAMAADWHMPVSFEPELYAISIGKKRYTLKLIQASRVFCINYMPYSLKEKVLYCGRNSGEMIDKIKESGLTKEECNKIDCCRIKENIAYLECEVVQEIDAGDHILFIGKVLKSEEKTREKRSYHTRGNEFTTTE